MILTGGGGGVRAVLVVTAVALRSHARKARLELTEGCGYPCVKKVGGLPVTKLAALCVIALLLSGCVSSSVQPVGTSSYGPLAPTADVAVFMAESQVAQPFEVVAKISYADPGKYQMLELSDTFEPLRRKAREIGANGVIIDNSSPVFSGIISRGISVNARAIHLGTQPPPTAAQPTVTPLLPAQPRNAKDAATSLRELQKLHADGIITDQEYETKKAEILRRL